jgi:ABC-type transport system involved in Fe-S cluster assembly fused permease/ATPase subunit
MGSSLRVGSGSDRLGSCFLPQCIGAHFGRANVGDRCQGEYEIFREIANTQRDKTTIIISHRFSTVRNANTIVVLEHGRITERGTHEELVKQAGRYKSLFELQAEGYR